MATDDDYILGTDREELERLGQQHEAWVDYGTALWQRAGFREGLRLLDLGCGPGFTTLDLATVVGSTGTVIGQDQNAGFLAYLDREVERRGLTNVEILQCRIEALELEAGAIDGAYTRWLFCWPEAPQIGLARVAEALRPGAALAAQEYVHWASLRLFPRSILVERAVDACMQSFADGGGTIDIAGELPALGRSCGLTLESLQPIARVGGVDSPEWRWIGGFFRSYLPRLVERGLLTADEVADVFAEWDARTADGPSQLMTPTVADVVLRKR